MNMMKMLQQAKSLQKNMEGAQAELAKTEVTGTSGGGAVSVTLTCGYVAKKVMLKPEAVDPQDIETLEDLLLTATADALKKVQDTVATKMKSITGGMGLPAGF
ncbi:MAG: YbaB/EbfC family nucleoid-associated protein [Alphaproteobacteria bacterium]